MNWIYVVTWCLIMTYYEDVPVYDEFGRYKYSYYNTKIDTDCGHKKHFLTKDSALIFMERAKKEKIEVSLDSINLSKFFDESVQKKLFLDTMYINER